MRLLKLEQTIRESVPQFTAHHVDKEAMLESVMERLNRQNQDVGRAGQREIGPVVQGRRWQRQHRTRRSIYWSAAAVIALAGVAASGYVSPAMASAMQNIPVIGELYTFKNPAADKYLASLDQGVTDHGITFRVTNAYYDGMQLFMVYQIQVPSDYKPVDGSQLQLNPGAVTLNGQPIGEGGFAAHQDSLVGPGTYKGLIQVLSAKPDALPADGSVQVAVGQVGQVSGQWNLTVPVSRDAVDGATQLTTLKNVEATADGVTLAVKKVSQGPVYTAISMEMRQPLEANDQPKYPMTVSNWSWWFNVSADGKQLDADNLTAGQYSVEGNEAVWDFTFECQSPPSGVKSLVIEPSRWNPSLSISDQPASVSVPLTGQFPIQVKLSGYGTTDIDGIDYEQDKTLVRTHLEADGLEHPDFWLQGPDGQVYKSSGTESALGVNEATVVFPAIPKGEPITVHAERPADVIGQGAFEPVPQLTVTVPLQP